MSEYKQSEYTQRSAAHIGGEARWERPFTAKRYIHPPLSERIVTMWPSFMVMSGEVTEAEKGKYFSSAFRILTGEEANEIPFEKTIYYTRDDGIPIHKISIQLNGCILEMECFCNICRKSTAFARLTIKNTLDTELSQCLCIIPRSGNESLLTGMEVDGYCHFNQNINNWGFIHSAWRRNGSVMEDGKYSIRFNADGFDVSWQGDGYGLPWKSRHLLKLRAQLQPHEEKTVTISFDQGECTDFDYEKERGSVISFWRKELAKIKVFINETNEMKALQNNLTAQMLQMFAYPVGKDYVLPRQGGLQRAIWPVEALEFLTALDRTGDFYLYTEKAYETFFDIMQAKNGNDKGAVLNMNGQMWASNTGGAVWGLSRHLIFRNDKRIFLKFRTSLLDAYVWMQKMRSITKNGDYAGRGVFPPMQATDWEEKYQSWCWTDGNNIMGYKWMAEAFEKFNDPKAGEIRAAYNDYMKCMEKIVDEQAAKNTEQNEFNLSNRLGYPPVDPQIGAVGNSAINLFRAGVIKPGSTYAQLIENYYRGRGYGRNGLMGLMGDGLIIQGHSADYWAGHTWYTNATDICWFYNWLNGGEREKAGETLKAQMKYSMTPEYYMCERYADNDPYFVPWLPNASACGRTVMMLVDFYE